MKRVIVAGGRDYENYERVKIVLDEYRKENDNIEIVCGCAKGADSLGDRYAKEHGIPIKYFPADWEKNGRAAGPIRNSEMLDYAGKDGCLIAFWDGKSRGTRDIVTKAEKKGIEVKIFLY